jgi:uncharacterized protein (TIGR02217 family)
MSGVFMESPRFPENISRGVTFGPEFVTAIGFVPGGDEQRNRSRAKAKCIGECAHGLKSQTDLTTLIKFFRSVGGRYAGFRFKDWSDYQCVQADSLVTLIAGATSQLQKLYQSAVSFNEVRDIRKPVTGTIVVYNNGTPLTVTTNYTIDYTTGIVTFIARATRNITAVTVGATTQITLASTIGAAIGNSLYLTGLTGADAALLNGGTFAITNIAGAVYTLNVNTAGKTITAAGTAAWYYGGTGDVLTWAGEFDVPCRFDTDRMATSIQDFGIYAWNQIPIKEIPA